MANYANQKRIVLGHLPDIIHHEKTVEQWLQPVKWAPIKEAMRILSGNGFKLYMYLLSWEGNKYYDFSPAGIAKELKMSDEGARNARKELYEKGFLIDCGNSNFEFYPISRTTVSSQKI